MRTIKFHHSEFLRWLWVVFSLLSWFVSGAQNQNWAFGRYCGVGFGTGSPLNFATNPSIYQREGVASISDNSGTLIFYTDGQNVWNRNNTRIRDYASNTLIDLDGSNTSTQSAVIVPDPGNSDRYYIFTTKASDAVMGGEPNGFKYSIVDMSVRPVGAPPTDPLGALLSENTVLYQDVSSTSWYTTEKVAAVKKCDGKNYWVITHAASGSTTTTTDEYVVYSLDASGVSWDHNQNIGSQLIGNSIGYLKFSPEGTKLANALSNSVHTLGFGNAGGADVFDFDNTSGYLSNWKEIPYPSVGTSSYGIEFSPNSKYLYVSDLGNGSATKSSFYQFDLTAGTQSNHDIYMSNVMIAEKSDPFGTDPYYYGALQLALDGKIYVAQSNSHALGVIAFPNHAAVSTSANGTNFTNSGWTLPTSATCQIGLPNNYSQSISPVLPPYSVHVSGCDTGVYIGNPEASTGAGYIYSWTSLTPGTPDPIPNNVPYVFVHPSITSVYMLVYTSPHMCVSDTLFDTVYVTPCCVPPAGILGGLPDTICAGTVDTLLIGGAPYFRFIVDNGSNPDVDGHELLYTAEFNQAFGGVPISPGGWDLGWHHLCLIYYSDNPDSVPNTCTDTICADAFVKNCGCEAFKGQTHPVITEAHGLVYDFSNTNGDMQGPDPDFINWYVDGNAVGQTTNGGHLTYTFSPGNHVVCMDVAHILFDAGPNGNSICCYDRQCQNINIDSCIVWRATDSLSYSLDSSDYRHVTFTYMGNNSPAPVVIWNYGDGTTSIGYDQTVTHTYTSDSDYTVCAVVIWSKGDSITYDSLGVCCCVDTICMNVSVSPCSISQFAIEKGADGDTHNYDIVHSAGFVSILDVTWIVTTDHSSSTRPETGVFMSYTTSDAITTVCADISYRIDLPTGETKCSATVCLPDTFGDLGANSRIRAYPNPTTGNVVVEITNYQGGKTALIEVLDMTGQILMSDQLNSMSKGTSQNVLSINKLPAGIYTMRVTIDDKRQVAKLIKQ